MVCPPLRARVFGSDAENVGSGAPALDGFAGKTPAMRERAGKVGDVGEITYRLERTTPTA
ncbi:hypothetical protein M0R89_18490 (plasmid) [Halorussus limi]|uniref:Uncharacterized protein n=1 Tax=Halorussus limi TaxID=2938695 RepID=A0A8U0HZE6_9EURY|nr:hypothetical protein [Halorussus limi]UPV76522.1 hypothetical protein M0R89_18490 [Halorussus limi]